MIEILKRQWFVVLVAIIFLGFTFFSIVDTNKDRVKGKKHDGKDVVASLKDDSYIYADDLYKELYDSYGVNTLSTKFQIEVVSSAVKSTKDLKTAASNYKANFLTQAEQQMSMYGYQDLRAYIDAQLSGLGYSYDTIDDYSLLAVKINKLTSDYVAKNQAEIFAKYYKEKAPRSVSHILIKMKDATNPTDEEMKKVKEVEKALKEGKDFGEVAKKYSDDPGSAERNGFLGLMDKDTQFVESFKTAALNLKANETSEWVKEKNDNYSGWHMIKVHETDEAKLLKDKDLKDDITNALLNYDSSAYGKAVWEASKKLDIKFSDKKLEEAIRSSLGL